MRIAGDPSEASGNAGRKEEEAMTTQSDQTPPSAPADFEGAIQESLARIQSIYSLVPDFELVPPEGITVERSARSISDEFLEASVVAIEADQPLKNVSSLDTAAARLVIQRNLRFEIGRAHV